VESDGLPNVPKLGFPDNYFVNPALHRAFENFWADRPGPGGVGLQERYAAAWRHVAQRFRSARGVLGYEIMNEPFPGGDYLTCASPAGCPASDAELTGLEHKVDRAIRGVDRRTLVFYEPYVTFNFGYPDHVGSLGDPRAVFAWHDYCLTNEAAGCSSQARTMSNAAAHVAQTGEGSFMTEFGATTSQTDLDRMVSLADQNMVPWTEWSYCTCGDPTGAPDEGLVLDPTKPKTAANLSTPILRSLVEPYPRVVAGIPLAWGFARSTRTFQLRYRTARASGHGSFRAGALTEISVPGLVFGRRYAVRVKGGAIVSAAGAPVLEIAACRGARSIDVEVGPGRRRAGSCRLHRHRRRARH
jgi:endoglycosylceramidase